MFPIRREAALTHTRRTLLGAAGLTFAANATQAAAPPRTVAEGRLTRGAQVIPLWPGAPPGGGGAGLRLTSTEQGQDPAAHPDRWLTGVARPVLLKLQPARPNGAAVVLAPGGGYAFLAFDNEGTAQARWLNAEGVTAYILLYRLPAEGWSARALAPLQDAQRAIRVVRARAAVDGIDPARVGAIGFSAGGHLVGSLATRAGEATYAPVDAADRLSARPDLVGLVYPVVSMSAPFTHDGSRVQLLGPASDEAARRRNSVELGVTAGTPPAFIVHAGDDGLVPVANSLALYMALQGAGRPAELHVFAEGGHGFGVRLPAAAPASRWPELFSNFARRRGLIG